RVVRAAAIPRLEDSRVAADDEMLGVVRIDPHPVIVLMVAEHARAPRVATVIRELEINRHAIEAVWILRVDANLREVEWAVVDRAAPRPRFTGIGRAIEAAQQTLRLRAAHRIRLDHHIN